MLTLEFVIGVNRQCFVAVLSFTCVNVVGLEHCLADLDLDLRVLLLS